MPHQPYLISETREPYDTGRQAEREKYLARLRQILQDPDFRKIEGFPIGDDEAILALSDPPYYTACPNPFLPEIIEKWQQEREAGRGEGEQGSEGEEEIQNPKSKIQNSYHREPFATDVSEGKNDPIYNAHSYHTKVPHKAIMRYILHYTEPGDIVFDGFCGTGMTGVAAQLCADRKTVESLGYFVDDAGNIYDRRPPVSQKAEEQRSRGAGEKLLPRSPAPLRPISKLGARKAVLCDLSPAATFIAYNYNTPVDVRAFEQEAQHILAEVEAECGWMYETLHTDGKTKGRINYVVWSSIFRCPECGYEMIFWDVAVNPNAEEVKSQFSCPNCSVELSKLALEPSYKTVFNKTMGQTTQRAKQVPVLINYFTGQKRYQKSPDEDDMALLERIENNSISKWFPTTRIDGDIDIWYERDYRKLGVYSVDAFFTLRNLRTIATLWEKVVHPNANRSSKLATYSLTGIIGNLSKMNRWPRMRGPLTGTLYIPSIYYELNPLFALERRRQMIVNIFSDLRNLQNVISTQSSTDLNKIPNSSIDYIFTDPPFGSNIIYSDLSIIWESWLKISTSTPQEAVIHRRKQTNPGTFETYQILMTRYFSECYRILKEGRWLTVEFHNTQNRIWNIIQEAILRAGFVIADVRTLDKKQGSFKQLTASGAVKQDLVISAYKPHTDFEQQFLAEGGREKGAWEFVHQHLEQLPRVVEKEGTLEIVAERQAYLLYDRMVAFHIQRGFSVPLSAAEFYAGLKQRFPERDGMYFLPAQAAEYDRRRLQVQRVEQLALFVTDEKSALQWLQRELDPESGSGPQTYQELQPKFLRELHQARHEKLPELRDLLEENFIQDELERWLVPNPERQEHLEQLRERGLLREFQEYAAGKGRLKLFRTEAVRAGFKRAWADKNYRLIVQVAQRLPDSVLQEDPGLLMYYDNALMRAEKEPRQLGF